MSPRWSSILTRLWMLLGAGMLVSAGIDAWDLALSEFAHKIGIWLTVALFALFGIGAIVLGWQITAPTTSTKVLGAALCALSLFYTFFVLAITPDHAIVRPLLAVQAFVIALAAWTIIFLWRTPRRTAANPEDQ